MTDNQKKTGHEHIWWVPDLAFFDGQGRNAFQGKCECGAKIVKLGAEWTALRSTV